MTGEDENKKRIQEYYNQLPDELETKHKKSIVDFEQIKINLMDEMVSLYFERKKEITGSDNHNAVIGLFEQALFTATNPTPEEFLEHALTHWDMTEAEKEAYIMIWEPAINRVDRPMTDDWTLVPEPTICGSIYGAVRYCKAKPNVISVEETVNLTVPEVMILEKAHLDVRSGKDFEKVWDKLVNHKDISEELRNGLNEYQSNFDYTKITDPYVDLMIERAQGVVERGGEPKTYIEAVALGYAINYGYDVDSTFDTKIKPTPTPTVEAGEARSR